MSYTSAEPVSTHPRHAGGHLEPAVRAQPPTPRRFTHALILLAACALGAACDGSSPTAPCVGPMNVGGNITRPVKIFAPQPQYTEEARQARVQGVVIIQAIIDCRGLVTDINVLQGLPLGLTEAAVAAISQWRFEPAMADGRPVSVYYNLTVNFRLQ